MVYYPQLINMSLRFHFIDGATVSCLGSKFLNFILKFFTIGNNSNNIFGVHFLWYRGYGYLECITGLAQAIYISMTQLFSAAKFEHLHLAIKVDEMQTSF